MSKDKLHIDDLFKQLKNAEYDTDMSMFDEIQAKKVDGAWAEKFNNYAHAESDIPPYEALALPITDKSTKPGKAYWGTVILSGIIALFLMTASAFNPLEIRPNNIARNTADKMEAAEINSDTKVNRSISSEGVNQTPEINESEALVNNLAKRNTPVASAKSKLMNKNQSQLQLVSNSIEKQTPIKLNQLTPKTDFIENIQKSTSGITPAKELKSTAAFIDKNWKPRSISRAVSKSQGAFKTSETFGNSIKTPKLKAKPQLFINAGINNYTGQAQLVNTKEKSTFGFHLNTGLEMGRFQFHTGLENNSFSYQTNLQTIQIYDSIPHIGMNGDTIGWFRRNLRDSTINSNLLSQISITSIPFHISFKPIQFRKFSFGIGMGVNINIIKPKSLWFQDENTGYLANYATSANNAKLSKKTNFGVGFSARIGYRITPLKELYTRLQVMHGPNILSSGQQVLKNNGVQIDFGMKYYLKALR